MTQVQTGGVPGSGRPQSMDLLPRLADFLSSYSLIVFLSWCSHYTWEQHVLLAKCFKYISVYIMLHVLHTVFYNQPKGIRYSF